MIWNLQFGAIFDFLATLGVFILRFLPLLILIIFGCKFAKFLVSFVFALNFELPPIALALCFVLFLQHIPLFVEVPNDDQVIFIEYILENVLRLSFAVDNLHGSLQIIEPISFVHFFIPFELLWKFVAVLHHLILNIWSVK